MIKRILTILITISVFCTLPVSAAEENYFIATMKYEDILINIEVLNDNASIHVKSNEEDINTHNVVNSSKLIKDFIKIFSIVDDTEILDNTDNYVELEYSFKGETKAFTTHNIDKDTALKIYEDMLETGNASVFASALKTFTVIAIVPLAFIIMFLARKGYGHSKACDTNNDSKTKNVENDNNNQ